MEIKKIDLSARQFEANGKKYFIESSLSIERYAKYEEIETELGFGRGFAQVFDEVRAAMDDINKQKQGDAYVKLYNLVNGVQQLEIKKPSVFRFCALFINEENEDRATITDDVINQKINDWQAEGLDYEPFFSFAINSLSGFKDRYRKLIQGTLPEQNQESEM